jgi:hypothetical protein
MEHVFFSRACGPALSYERVGACLRCFSRPKLEHFPNPLIKKTRRVPLDAKRDSARVSEYYIIILIDDSILWCYAMCEIVVSASEVEFVRLDLLANSIQL